MVLQIKYFFVLLLMIVTAYGCKQEPGQQNQHDSAEIRETLAKTNRIMLDAENQEIQDFIERFGWDMKETGSGLRYWIYDEGNGPRAESGMTALISYQIHLLTGDLVYSSLDEGPKEFRIGRGGVESGLEEAILLMKKGDKAKFIMPAHLAHGLPGDGVKIPLRATIVYDVELNELK